jgi:hypothetical protein
MEAGSRILLAGKGGASMRKILCMLGLAGLLAAGFVALTAGEASALKWKDCQEIAECTGCRPVYKCRSCSYQRQCIRGLCQWGDVCVWSPALKYLPRGTRIIQVQ